MTWFKVNHGVVKMQGVVGARSGEGWPASYASPAPEKRGLGISEGRLPRPQLQLTANGGPQLRQKQKGVVADVQGGAPNPPVIHGLVKE